MIGRLTGRLVDKQPPQLLIDVQGVGYEVEAPMSTFYKLPATGESVALFTQFIVREDAQLLYGFATQDERRLFRDLIKVSGVGPKIAMAVLSGISTSDFALAIQQGDIAQIVRVPGIGKKTAERLVVELRDKLANGSNPIATTLKGGTEQEAYSALLALGYKPPEAQKLLQAVSKPDLTSEQLIRAALQAALKK